MRKWSFTFGMTIASFLCGTEFAFAEPMRLVIIDFPPFFSIVEEGKPLSGFSVELMREMERRTGGGGEVAVLPIARMLKVVEEDPNYLSVAVFTEPRAASFKWLDEIGVEKQVVATRKGNRVSSLDALPRNTTLGVLMSSSMETLATKMGFRNLEAVRGEDQNLKKLLRGRIDAWLSYQGLIGLECKRNGLDMSSFDFSDPVTVVRGYFITSKKTDEAVFKPYSDAFKAMRSDGAFDRILKQYEGMVSPPQDGDSPVGMPR